MLTRNKSIYSKYVYKKVIYMIVYGMSEVNKTTMLSLQKKDKQKKRSF